MEKLEIIEIKNLLANSEISAEMSKYQITAEFLKQAGGQLYIKRMIGQSSSAEDIKMFTDKLVELKNLAEKLCSLSTTKV